MKQRHDYMMSKMVYIVCINMAIEMQHSHVNFCHFQNQFKMLQDVCHIDICERMAFNMEPFVA